MIALYIILGILLFLALLISAIISLPIKIIISYSESKGLDYKIKILFYTLKREPKDRSVLQLLRDIKNLEDANFEKVKHGSVSKKGLFYTVKETLELLKFVFGYLGSVLGSFKISKLNLDIVCADADDTAKAATDYGKVCAIVYPVLGFIQSNLKVNKKKERINIICDYLAEKPSFTLDTVLSIRVVHVLSAFMPTLKKIIKNSFSKAKLNQYSIEKRG